MRLGVIIDEGSFYAPRILARSSLREDHDVVGVWTREPGDPIASRLRNALNVSGPRYTIDRAGALSRLRRQRKAELRSDVAAVDLEMPLIGDLEAMGLDRLSMSTANSKEFRTTIHDLGVDMLISLFYGEILDPETFSAPRLGTINVHPSLLPALAGKNPVFWAMAEGLQSTGITIHEIDEGIDTGSILDQSLIAIEPNETHHELYLKVSDVVAKRLPIAVLQRTKRPEERSEIASTSERSYRSTPTPESYRSFRSLGHRFL
ncbi:MAG: hypothetical protein BMS9Abin07_0417 [Acidimicrobiia bacterium]|nr:MAG: hypothetical protein BMS9Abin07_0417 [Acidimicrobiia bacterium]